MDEWSYRQTHIGIHKLVCYKTIAGGGISFTLCESAFDIPGMRKDCQICPNCTAALLCSSVGSGLDESWLQRPKAGGFRPRPANRAGHHSNGQRDWNCSNSFCRIKKTTLLGLERGCSRYRFERRREKDLMWERLKSTIRPQPPALSFCLRIKNKTMRLDEDCVSVDNVMIRTENKEVIKWWIMLVWYL